jgi:phenylalanyl-tRNA synthetase alpha chain
MNRLIQIDKTEETAIKANFEQRNDFEALRIKRYISMADLSRTEGSPLFEMTKMVKSVKSLKEFDQIEIPEVIPTTILFDLFDFAKDHPARSKSDTYYMDEKNVLRTHDTVMWYYYLNHPDIKKDIEEKKNLGVLCFGKVYRKDEIDRRHMNIFHQMGALFLQDDSKGIMPIEKLKEVLSEIVETLFGKDVKYRFLEDTFPYTDPSLQIEVMINDQWIEIMGGGMAKKSVLEKMGLTGYNGWAFGFGLERLATISMEVPDIRLFWSEDERVKKQLKLGNKYVEVSKYPKAERDISFIVHKSFIPNDYFDIIREIGGNMVEEVSLMDKYENESKFGKDKISYTYHITYRSPDKTLTSEEIEEVQQKLYQKTKEVYKAELR